MKRHKFPETLLELKIKEVQDRVKDWYEAWEGNVYISFSGGKDSSVLLDIARSVHPDIPGVFADTGLEFPEIRNFVKSKSNIIWIKPNKKFPQVIQEHGYPVISKKVATQVERIRDPETYPLSSKLHLYGHRSDGEYRPNSKLPNKWKFLINAPFKISAKCCLELKKNPIKNWEKENKRQPIIGMTRGESRQRSAITCNNYDSSRPSSNPLYDWTEEDIWNYIKHTTCLFPLFMKKGTIEPDVCSAVSEFI